MGHHSSYTKEIREELDKTLTSYEEAAVDTTDLYRRLLAQQPDTFVINLSIGHLINLSYLLEFAPNQYSWLQDWNNN